MKTDVTKVGRLLFFIGLLGFWSCEKEPILTKESIQEVPSISQARGTFLEFQYNSRGRSTAIPLEGKVDWQSSTAKDLTRKLKMLYTPVALESHYAKSFIASIQQQEKVQNRVFTVLYDEQHSTQVFSGVILIHNNKGDFVKAYEYVAGKRTKTYLPKVDGQGSRGRATNNDCSLTLEDIRIIVETFGLEGLNNLVPCLDIHADLDDGSNDGGGDNGLGDGNPLDVPLGDLDDNDNPGGSSSTGNGHTPWWDNNSKCKDGKVKNKKGECVCPKGTVKRLNGKCVQENDPCKTIKTSMSNPNRKAQVNELSKKLGKKKEEGYKQNKDGTYTKLKAKNNGHSLVIPVNKTTVGYIHTHVNHFPTGEIDKKTGREKIIKPIKTFSPNDIIQYLRIAKGTKYNGVPVHLTYGTVITSAGIYTLKYTGNVSDIRNDIKGGNAYNDIFKAYIKDTDIEKGLLKFLKEVIKVNGLELYKVDKNGNAKKKTLDSNGKVKTTDCQ